MYKRARWFQPRSLDVDRSTDLPVSSECHCFGASFTRNWIKIKVIKRLGVSRTYIREALLSLEDEGQVQNFSGVRDTCLEDQIEAVLESQFICEALECSVARYAARNRNDKLLESLSRKLKDYETALNDD